MSAFDVVTRLLTTRLVLLPLRLADVPAVEQHLGDERVLRAFCDDFPSPFSTAAALAYVTLLVDRPENEGPAWAIRLRTAPDETVGVVEFHFGSPFGWRAPVDAYGFWLKRALWRTGLMTEAVSAALDDVLLRRCRQDLRSRLASENVASRRIQRRHGGIRLASAEGNSPERDTSGEVWQITPQRWRAARRPPGTSRDQVGSRSPPEEPGRPRVGPAHRDV